MRQQDKESCHEPTVKRFLLHKVRIRHHNGAWKGFESSINGLIRRQSNSFKIILWVHEYMSD